MHKCSVLHSSIVFRLLGMNRKKQQFIDENDCLHQLFQINEENAEKWLEDMRFYKSHFAILTIAYSFS